VVVSYYKEVSKQAASQVIVIVVAYLLYVVDNIINAASYATSHW
jgi:hypothetical protein